MPSSEEARLNEPRLNEARRASAAQLAANRENATHSTGPKTQEGKNRSRMNTIAHGFTAQGVVLAEEDVPHYKRHLRDFREEHKPQGPTEAFYVETLAEISWTVSKIRAQEQNFLTIVGQTGANPFEGPDPEVNVLLAQANHSRANAKHIELLSRYEQRKMRCFRESLRELKQLQHERRQAERELAASQPAAPSSQPAASSAQPAAQPAAQPQPLGNPEPEIGFVCPEPKTMTAQVIETHPPHRFPSAKSAA